MINEDCVNWVFVSPNVPMKQFQRVRYFLYRLGTLHRMCGLVRRSTMCGGLSVDCIPKDPEHEETQEQLLEKKEKLVDGG
ncbi:MAG: hypothetical protein CM1200mP16_11640 [Nitrospina sp.]|nr:MAG: hypothetical protein CM1200mP16_11640 [Nitrospina sp.]